MVKQCCICKKLDYKNPEITFHGFPADLERKRLWLMALGYESNKVFPIRAKVCSDHFEQHDFVYKSSGKTFLKTYATPQAYYPQAGTSQISHSLQASSSSPPTSSFPLIATEEQNIVLTPVSKNGKRCYIWDYSSGSCIGDTSRGDCPTPENAKYCYLSLQNPQIEEDSPSLKVRIFADDRSTIVEGHQDSSESFAKFDSSSNSEDKQYAATEPSVSASLSNEVNNSHATARIRHISQKLATTASALETLAHQGALKSRLILSGTNATPQWPPAIQRLDSTASSSETLTQQGASKLRFILSGTNATPQHETAQRLTATTPAAETSTQVDATKWKLKAKYYEAKLALMRKEAKRRANFEERLLTLKEKEITLLAQINKSLINK